MAKRSAAAEHAIAHPPQCLSGVALTALPPTDERGSEISATFAVRCKACDGGSFRIYSYPKVVPDPSPYLGLNPGDWLLRPPHILECTACGTRACVFDPRKHGYDAVLNSWCGYECGDEGEEPAVGEFTVLIWVTYNTELGELAESGEETGVDPSDLFDWFGIEGRSPDGAIAFTQDYECA